MDQEKFKPVEVTPIVIVEGQIDRLRAARRFYAGLVVDTSGPNETESTDAPRLESFPGVHIAYTDKPNQTCADSRPLTDCESGRNAIIAAQKAAQEAAHATTNVKDGENTWTTYIWTVGASCVGCTLGCVVEPAVLVSNGEPTEIIRLAFIRA